MNGVDVYSHNGKLCDHPRLNKINLPLSRLHFNKNTQPSTCNLRTQITFCLLLQFIVVLFCLSFLSFFLSYAYFFTFFVFSALQLLDLFSLCLGFSLCDRFFVVVFHVIILLLFRSLIFG